MTIIESKIPVGTTGENLRSFEVETAEGFVQIEAVTAVDPEDINGIQKVINSVPASDAYGAIVRVAGPISVSLPTNAAQETGGNLAAILAELAVLTNGMQVTSIDNFPSIQGIAGTVAVSNFPATQPVSGSVAVSNFPATQPVSGSVSVSNFPATQPVSAVALPLPANAAQETGGNLASLATHQTDGTQKTQVTNFPTTQAISAAALPLPTGASTSALQTTGNTSLSSIDGKTPTVGQKVMAASVPVAIASDQSAIPVTVSNFPAYPLSIPGTMIPLGATDVVFAKSASTGIRSFWSYVTTSVGNTVPADLPLTTPASIGPGIGVQGSYRLNMQDDAGGGTPSGAAGTQVTLYLTSASNPIVTFTIPQGGSAVWDGVRPWLYNTAGILQ